MILCFCGCRESLNDLVNYEVLLLTLWIKDLT
jgi:hypothetical protein